jgi:hypothetical protein
MIAGWCEAYSSPSLHQMQRACFLANPYSVLTPQTSATVWSWLFIDTQVLVHVNSSSRLWLMDEREETRAITHQLHNLSFEQVTSSGTIGLILTQNNLKELA